MIRSFTKLYIMDISYMYYFGFIFATNNKRVEHGMKTKELNPQKILEKGEKHKT